MVLTNLIGRRGYVIYPSSISAPNVDSTETNDSLTSDLPVAVLILQAFGIPILNPGILSNHSTLPGYDIYNQPCAGVLQLSLATQFVEGHLTECYINEEGQAYFVNIGETVSSVTTDQIRFVIPLVKRIVPVDVVFVTGLKPPVRRELRGRINGTPNKETIDWAECKREDINCTDKNYSNFATIIYDDPVLSSTINDGIHGSFEKKDWEDLVGFVVDFDVPSINDYVNLQINFSKEETKFPVKLALASMGSSSKVEIEERVYEACKAPIKDSELLYGVKYNVSGFTSPSIYDAERGKEVSDLIGINSIYIVGQKILYFRDYSTLAYYGAGATEGIAVVEEKRSVYELEYGKNWLWSGSPADGEADIWVFYDDRENLRGGYSNDGVEVRIGDFGGPLIKSAIGSTQGVSSDYLRFTGVLVPGIGDVVGYAVSSLCALISRRKPSITVTTTDGKAKEAAEKIDIDYIPIIIVSEPPPIAYAMDGESGILDQKKSLFDTDPLTVQTHEDVESDHDRIIDRTNGIIMELALPFADENECLYAAQTIYNFSSDSDVETFSYTLGPDADPHLGELFSDGLNSTVINEITYSYTDSSSYNIQIITGSAFLGMNSWSDGRYVMATEEVQRNGKVTADLGDGSSYKVLLEGGLGEVVALSTILERIEVGDVVSVTIYNNPVERR